MQGQEPTSGFEHLAKNVFARVGSIVTGIAAVATALYQLGRDIALTLEGLLIVLAIVSSTFVVTWRSSKVVDDKKVSTPFFPKKRRIIAAVVLVLGIALAIPYGIQVANIVIKRDQQEKQLEAIQLSALTPQPTATATATATVTFTPPPGAPLTAIAQSAQATVLSRGAWPIVLSDSFSSNFNGWPSGSSTVNLELGSATRSIANGKYRIELKGNRRYIQLSTPNAYLRLLSDFYATADVQRTSGPTTADIGLAFRMDPTVNVSNYYVFTLNDNRSLIVQSTIEGKGTQLARLDQIAAVKPGAVNRLGVVGQGSHFDILINDQLITSFDDSRYKEGRIAIWTGVMNAGEEAVFEVTNFQVRTP